MSPGWLWLIGQSAQHMSPEVTDRSAVPSELSHHLNCLTVIPETLGHLNPHTFIAIYNKEVKTSIQSFLFKFLFTKFFSV